MIHISASVPIIARQWSRFLATPSVIDQIDPVILPWRHDTLIINKCSPNQMPVRATHARRDQPIIDKLNDPQESGVMTFRFISARQHLIFDADDTLWENNIYFERIFITSA